MEKGCHEYPSANVCTAQLIAMIAAFQQGNPEELINRTHPSLYALFGGKEEASKATREAIAELQQTVKFISHELGTPTKTFSAGAEEVCFFPTFAVMEVQGKRLKSTSFMVAIRRVGDTEWKYLDGAGLRNHPDLLSQLLPELDPKVEYPENTIEAL